MEKWKKPLRFPTFLPLMEELEWCGVSRAGLVRVQPWSKRFPNCIAPPEGGTPNRVFQAGSGKEGVSDKIVMRTKAFRKGPVQS